MKYYLRLNERVTAWLRDVPDAERRSRVLTWMDAVERGPELLVSYEWRAGGAGERTLYASEFKPAEVTLIYFWSDAPLRVVVVVNLIDHGQTSSNSN